MSDEIEVLRNRDENLVDYTQFSDGELMRAVGMDGVKWADAFMQMWGNRLSDINHSLMTTWFCNAIMSGYDTACGVKVDE
jgi:hypothetical protein